MSDSQKFKIPNKKTFIITIAGLVVVSSVMTGFTLFKKEETTPNKVYRETKITRGNLTVGVNETATASLKTVALKSKVAADIEKVYVKAGQQVKKDDPIAKLSVDSVDTQIKQLELEYKKAELTLQQNELALKSKLLEFDSTKTVSGLDAKNAQSTYDSTLIQLGNDINTLEDTLEDQDNQIDDYEDKLDLFYEYSVIVTNYEKSHSSVDNYNDVTIGVSSSDEDKEYVKAKKWLEDNDTTSTEIQNKIDSLELSYDNNQTQLANSMEEYEKKLEEAKLTLAKSQQTGTDAQATYELAVAQIYNDITISRIDLQVKEEEIEDLKDQASDGIIKATCDGLIYSISVSDGDTVAKNATIATMSDSNNVMVNASISQDDITSLSLGQTANITLTSYEKQTFTGVIDSITITPARTNTSSVSYTVLTTLNKGADVLVYEGMTGTVTFIKKQLQNVLYVSNRAITTESNKQYITLKDASGNPKKVEVTTGFSDGKNVEITSGVSEGDTALIESVVQTK